MDKQTDRQAENNRAQPTFFGGSLTIFACVCAAFMCLAIVRTCACACACACVRVGVLL